MHKAGQNVEKLNYLHIAGVMENYTAILGNNLVVSYKTKHTTSIQPSNYTLRCFSLKNENSTFTQKPEHK